MFLSLFLVNFVLGGFVLIGLDKEMFLEGLVRLGLSEGFCEDEVLVGEGIGFNKC